MRSVLGIPMRTETEPKPFNELNPIERCLYANNEAEKLQAAAQIATGATKQSLLDAAQTWAALAVPHPGGWLESDDDGHGPWWYVYELSGKTYVTARDSKEYNLIRDAITLQRNRRR